MGVSTFLVSDSKKEFFDFGKVFLEEEVVESLQKNSDGSLLREWLRETNGEYNSLRDDEITRVAAAASTWMLAHPDWRFLTEADDEYDDVYLAEDDEDAREYLADGGPLCEPIYKKTGGI